MCCGQCFSQAPHLIHWVREEASFFREVICAYSNIVVNFFCVAL